MTVREVYRLLKAAPNKEAAMRLASRLHRSAREGRVMKDGRKISTTVVDEGMDAWLASEQRTRSIAEKMSQAQEGGLEETQGAAAQDAAPRAEPPAPAQWIGAAAEEEERAEAPSVEAAPSLRLRPDGAEDSSGAGRGDAAGPPMGEDFQVPLTAPARPPKPSLRERLLAMKAEKERAAEVEEMKRSMRKENWAKRAKDGTAAEESQEPGLQGGFLSDGEEVFDEWKIRDVEEEEERLLEETERRGRIPLHRRQQREERQQKKEVPQELKDKIVSTDFNYVDRVWSAPTANDLPRAPDKRFAAKTEAKWLRLPHIAVNGMTNSGKSTLINHCIKWSYAAKASSRPGKTTSIDFYVVNDTFVLVDFPGYPDPDSIANLGVMKEWEARWEALVMGYIKMCVQGDYDLRLLLHLQRSKSRPTIMCRSFVDKIQELNLPGILILTKDDQLDRGHEERYKIAESMRNYFQFKGPHLHYTTTASLPSSRKARKQLHRWIRTSLNAESVDDILATLKQAGDRVSQKMAVAKIEDDEKRVQARVDKAARKAQKKLDKQREKEMEKARVRKEQAWPMLGSRSVAVQPPKDDEAEVFEPASVESS